jgi:predicted nucleic acid-binding protein
VIAVDTSVAVAAFAAWHEQHAVAIRALSRETRLPGHVALETLAVLTRLPPPHRAPADLVVRFLAANFPQAMLTLPAREYRALLRACVRLGIVGGSVYDALIAATAARAGAVLLSLDRRAHPVYEAIGVEVRFLGDG